jgi:hypothetical protein
LNLGCRKATLDRAVFTFHGKDGELEGLMTVHVDDCLYVGTKDFTNKVVEPLLSTFNIGRIETDSFTYTGWDITQTSKQISIGQSSYIDKLEMDELSEITNTASSNFDVMSSNGQHLFRRVVGILSWIAQISKPESSYQVTSMSGKFGKATLQDGKKALRVLKNALNDEGTIIYKTLNNMNKAHILVYSDAAFGKLDRSHSSLGMLLFIVGENNNASLIEWFSKKTSIPVTSPLASKAEAAKEAFAKAVFIQAMFKDLTVIELPIKMMTDAKSLKDHVDADNATKDRRIALAVGILKEATEKEQISLKWIPTHQNLADILTKDSVNPFKLRSSLQQSTLPLL